MALFIRIVERHFGLKEIFERERHAGDKFRQEDGLCTFIQNTHVTLSPL